MLQIIFRPGAQTEMRDAYSWYEESATGLGIDFIRRVEVCVELIRQYPEIFPVIHKNVRQGIVRRFPYSIYYIPTKEKIIILSVFHSSREPKRWTRG